MAYEAYDHMTSAELQREIAEERRNIDRKISELQARMDPGRIADSLLNSRMVGDVIHATTRGGADFAGNLGRTVSANPLPAALLGISLAWLMTGQRSAPSDHHTTHASMPHRTIDGDSLRRISHARDEAGDWYSEFADEAGKSFRAKSNEAGHRIGHFMDDAGQAVGGFVDKSGRAVTRFTDEAGAALDDAAGWARDAAAAVADAVSGVASQAGKTGSGISRAVSQVGSDVADSASDATKVAVRTIEEQPLIAAAIAFAAGAAIAAALPRTRQEDEVMGELSDQARAEAAQAGSSLYEQGKQRVSEVYKETSEEVGELYEEAKEKLAGDSDSGHRADVRH